mgnify:CR=1 FL=1
MFRRLIKAAQDRLLKSKNDKGKDPQAPAPPPPQVEIKPPPHRPAPTTHKTTASDKQTRPPQQKGPPREQGEYRRRHRRKRPSSNNRTTDAPSPPTEKTATAKKTYWNPSEFKVAPADGKTRFHDLNLPEEIMHGIFDAGFEYCTPIQAAILPKTLAGTDASGKAQTGTGKTAAFLITILTHLKRNPPTEERHRGVPRALIMAPTRELALQITKEANLLGKYCGFRIVTVFGGLGYGQQRQMLAQNIVDIVVATPGRLLDFKDQGIVHLGKVEILVIDEADEMLNMGFIPDIRKIVNSTPPRAKRQTMFFGATITTEVTHLASQWTRDPVTVEIDPEQVAVDSVDQVLYLVTSRERFTVLYNMIAQQNLKRVLVFCNRRDEARRLSDRLKSHGMNSALLSGDVAQTRRISTLEGFRDGRIRVMVSTDVAGRGIHIEDISHVFNYDLPLDTEDYVHRIGRTGRAGSLGTSVSFATEHESYMIPKIEEFLGKKLHCVYPDNALLKPVPSASVIAHPTQNALSDTTRDQSSPPRKPRRRRPRKKPGTAGGAKGSQPPADAPKT